MDNNGKLPDLLWDVASIALGVHSFIRNIEAGNTKGAIGDGLGIVVDVVAAAIPFIPGGVGTIRNGVKVASAIDVGKSIETTFDVSKNISSSTCLDDFIIISPEHQIDRSLLKKPEKRGNAFLFKEDGTPVEIHHVGQNINGPYIEMHQKDHRGKENYKKYHTLPSKNSQIDRKEFAKKRREYWQKVRIMVTKLIEELQKYDGSVVSFGKGALEREIKETEMCIGLTLPDQYKEFVRMHNGLEFMCEYILRVGNNVQPSAFSMNEVYFYEHFESHNPMPIHLIPFSPDGYGNHYCFDMLNNGVVVFWQHDLDYNNKQPEVVYQSMVEMIRDVFINWSDVNYDGTSKEDY